MKRFLVVLSLICLLASAMVAQNVAGAKRTDVYHVHFDKATPGQAAALADVLKQQPADSPMPGHLVVLRHQQGDDWDYVVIQHLGTKTTVSATPASPTGPTMRGLSAWHTDTFVAGPPWADFAGAMGLTGEGAKATNPVYSVATWRAVPGHMQQLEQSLATPDPNEKVPVGHITLQHIEGGPWQFLAIDRYNSWQDFATNQSATGAGTSWTDIRQHSSWHHDTLTDRIAPAPAK